MKKYLNFSVHMDSSSLDAVHDNLHIIEYTFAHVSIDFDFNYVLIQCKEAAFYILSNILQFL